MEGLNQLKPTETPTQKAEGIIKTIPSIISTILAIGSIIFTMALFFTKVEAHDKQLSVQAQEITKAQELYVLILQKLAIIETKLATDGENIKEIKDDIKEVKKELQDAN